jgi:sugar lactone lactonase YvrE
MVEDLGEKGVADGLEEDTDGRIYITDWEKQAITRRGTDGTIETFVKDDRLLWPGHARHGAGRVPVHPDQPVASSAELSRRQRVTKAAVPVDADQGR